LFLGVNFGSAATKTKKKKNPVQHGVKDFCGKNASFYFILGWKISIFR
jgi:hypothetical protein